MAHPYAGHRENAVGHRRVKTLMKSGGYVKPRARANGGEVTIDEETAACPEPDADDMPVAEGQKQGGRLDKRARGGKIAKRATGGKADITNPWDTKPMPHEGPKPKARGGAVEKFAMGGGAFHKITPSKRKPHVNVNVVNINGRRGRGMGGPRPPLAINPGALPGPLPGPLPAPAGIALPPPGALPLKPPGMAKGGRAQMRKGKTAGEGSGSGRLEEFKHMKGR